MLLQPQQSKRNIDFCTRRPFSRTFGPRGFQSNGESRRETPFRTSNSIFSKKGRQKISIFCDFNCHLGELKWGNNNFSGSFFYTYNLCSPSVNLTSFSFVKRIFFLKCVPVITKRLELLNFTIFNKYKKPKDS